MEELRVENFCDRLAAVLQGRLVAIENESEYLNSAVLVPLIRQEGRLHVLFEVRSAMLNRQPGEICFPGGRIEPQDETALAAAIRETTEELGISKNQIQFIGALNYVVAPFGVILHPFAAYLQEGISLRPSDAEVAEVFTVPLDWLLNTEPQEAHMEIATRPLEGFPLHLLPEDYPENWKGRKTYPVLFYQYQKYVIWGLTARVLYSFLAFCRQVKGM
jgi:8-oxo-dGTP pyrophosphatase MutT (NUDIX family)